MIFWYVLATLLLIYVFIPRFGLLALYADWRGARQREKVEDASSICSTGNNRAATPRPSRWPGPSTCVASKRPR